MNPVVFALRHPYTVMVAVLAVAVAAALALVRLPIDIPARFQMPVDVFPALNLPVIYVAQPYGGMDPAQMEGLIASHYEHHFLHVGGIHHVESRNIQGTSLLKLYFQPGTDMAQAMAQTIGYVNRARAFMPPGTVPPFIMRFDTGSVPVGYLVLSSDTRSIGDIQDQAVNRAWPMFAGLPGVSALAPFGGSQRTIVVNVNPDRLRSYHLTPDDVISALAAGNTVSPSGSIRVQDQMPIVPLNAMVVQPKELGDIPVHKGSSIYLRDLGTIEDSTDSPSGYALVNGRRAVYIPVTKRAEASMLAVVNELKANLQKMQEQLPPDITVSFELDQSPQVTRTMAGVGIEALLGALLAGLIVLLFLRDWRSALVVVLNIPLALLGALVALWLTGQSINLMTLGGLALAVGILVDEATVEIENIHTQMGRSRNIAGAVRLGNRETAVPRLLAMLCLLAVFVPALIMEAPGRALFVPLALAVGFAMLTSYILSSTFVPVLSVWLLRKKVSGTLSAGHTITPADARGAAERVPDTFLPFRDLYTRLLQPLVALRGLLLAGYVLLTGGLAAWWLMGHPGLGSELFPATDAGQFQVRLRAASGTRSDRTEELTVQALDVIKELAGADNVAISLGYVGLMPSSSPINSVYLWTSGPEEAVLRVALRPDSGVAVEDLKARLRSELPRRLADWLRHKMRDEGMPENKIAERVRALKLSFEPADIVNEVMSFGAATPVEIAVSGPKLADNRAYAERLLKQLEQIPALRDLQFVQALDYPTVELEVDRLRANRSHVSVAEVARSTQSATSSSRFVVPNYWRDPATGTGYLVQVQIQPAQMNSLLDLETVPVGQNDTGQVVVRDVARVQEGTMPGQYDRTNLRRLVSLTANVQGEDLGSVAVQIGKALEAAGAPPRGMSVEVRGQIAPMEQIFHGLMLGLGLAALAIFLLLTAYFQSLRLALIVIATAPAVVAGVALSLLLTGTTWNIQSFLGAIMALGVAMANAILLVVFAERARREGGGSVRAAVDGAAYRLRPILMTSCAMIAGMMPLALAMAGSEQLAPLGRAVIGGLSAATLTTLFLLPALFALVQGKRSTASTSLDPADPASAFYDDAWASGAPDTGGERRDPGRIQAHETPS
jgi:multidrug efflux pump subunit AcrB